MGFTKEVEQDRITLSVNAEYVFMCEEGTHLIVVLFRTFDGVEVTHAIFDQGDGYKVVDAGKFIDLLFDRKMILLGEL